jgi:hypothetical protein
VQFLCSTGDFDALEKLLSTRGPIPTRLAPLRQSAEAILHAIRGRRAHSRRAARQSMSAARDLDAPLLLARVLSRCGYAAYYRFHYDEAKDLAIESAHIYESRAAYSNAAMSYSIAGIVAHEWNRDAEQATNYFQRMKQHAGNRGTRGFDSVFDCSTLERRL